MSQPSSFLQALRQHAQESADREAFQLVTEHGATRLTFRGLYDRVQRLGSALGERIEAGERIAICMENRPAWPVGYLATWYAGGVIVPIDPALEPAAIGRVLRHSGARLCLTSKALGKKVAEACEQLDDAPPLLDVDGGGDRSWDGESTGEGVAPARGDSVGTSWDELAGSPTRPPDAEWGPQEQQQGPATIVYTSGTTGTPKGVMLSREALVNNISAGLRRIEVTRDDNILAVLPLFHVLPLMANCLGPVWVAARVTFLTDLNPDRIIAAFPDHQISVFACVPLFYYRFHARVMKGIDAMPAARRRLVRALLRLNGMLRRRFSYNLGRRLFRQVHAPFGEHLRVFITGGARFDPSMYADFLALGFDLVQGYGLTEATAVLTAHPPHELRPDTVGPPVDGVELRIDGPNAEGVGEIQARTPARMLGYYDDPDATAEAFDGDWLRTGDLGRVRSDGHLEVTGREKDVIVLASGKNIYPEELEAHYGRSSLVEEICILGIEDTDRGGAERLHAVVVADLDEARRRGQANVREMVKWELEGLGSELPRPQRVTSLQIRTEPLPRTTTRKIKRFQLREEMLQDGRPVETTETGAAQAEEPEADEGPEPEWATDVREIVARVAKVQRVQRRQHLDLDLGLESLDRIELLAEIRDAFGIDIPEQAAGDVQTVADLLELIAEHLQEGARAEEATGDRWQRVLSKEPPDIQQYLSAGKVGPALLRGALLVARTLLRIPGYRATGKEHLPADYPFVLAPNHNSYVDPFLLGMSLPRRIFDRIFFVGYSGYFEGPISSRAARAMRTIPIDQNRQLERAMQAAAEGLRQKMVLGIFPEGARSSDGTLQDFRRGVGILARHAQVPVVPVGIWGTHEMWPRGGRWRPHATAVVFGKPLPPPPAHDPEGEEEFVTRLRERVAALVQEARSLHEDHADKK